MPVKLYFHDATGRELADHPLNGCEMNWAGTGLTTRGTRADRDAAGMLWKDGAGRIARSELGRFDFTTRKTITVTVADFGLRHVLVKAWHPGGAEWFWLVPEKNRLLKGVA
jgi:hypothetical protein